MHCRATWCAVWMQWCVVCIGQRAAPRWLWFRTTPSTYCSSTQKWWKQHWQVRMCTFACLCACLYARSTQAGCPTQHSVNMAEAAGSCLPSLHAVKACVYVVKACVYVVKACVYVVKASVYVVKASVYAVKACVWCTAQR